MAKKTDIPNKGHKHLFGSSEKSDFILNMTADGAQKMCGVYTIFALLIVAVAAIPAYFTQTVSDYTLEDGTVHYLSENFIFYAGAAIMLLGFVGYLIFMIACSKKQVSLRDNRPLLAPLAVMLLSAAACITSESIYNSLLGYLDRYEGLITILGYFGLFAVAMVVTADNRRIRISDFVVGIGLFQSAAGIVQSIPAASGIMHNFFEYLYIRPGTDVMSSSISENGEMYYDGGISGISGIYSHARAASGFATSPYALAAILTVAFACAAAGAAFDKSKARKIFYGVSAPIMAAAACLTRVLPGIVGVACAAVILLALAIAKTVSKTGSKSVIIIAAAVIGVSAAAGGVLFGTGAADLRDEQVVFTDGYVMRSITGLGRADTEKNFYTSLWEDGLYVAGQNPILGVGPDNQPYAYSKYGTVTDRYYNEYIDIAASRGIPCLIFYGIFLLISIAKMFKAVKNFVKGEEIWVVPAASAAALAYLVQAFFNTSWVNSTLYLYIMLGIVWSCGAVKANKKK